MKTQSNALKNSKDSIQKSWVKLNEKWNETKSYLKRSRDSINSGLNELKLLQDEYFLLKENSDQKIKESIEKNNSLIKKIAIKETELESRLDRVNELEKMINEQTVSYTHLRAHETS